MILHRRILAHHPGAVEAEVTLMPFGITHIRRLENGRLEVDDPSVIESAERAVSGGLLVRVPSGGTIEVEGEDGTTATIPRTFSYIWRKEGRSFIPRSAEEIVSPHDGVLGITPMDAYSLDAR